jgi:hypothetical protein
LRDEALWQRLSDYSFDRIGGSLTFPKKLARDAQWSAKFTRRAIDEYRRFLYLTQVSDAEVTPSAVVDVVWHLHLTYTREYWQELCDGVLGRPLHHDPCLGPEENPRYERQYEATRQLYADEFATSPPRDIWRTRRERMLSGLGVGMVVGGIVACYWHWFGLALIAVGLILWVRFAAAGEAGRFFRRAAARSGGGGGCGGG